MRRMKKLYFVLMIVFACALGFLGHQLRCLHLTHQQVEVTARDPDDSRHEMPHSDVTADKKDTVQKMATTKATNTSKETNVDSQDQKPEEPAGDKEAHLDGSDADDIARKWREYHKKQCRALNKNQSVLDGDFDPVVFRQFIVDDKRKMIFCQIPKVASTTWRRVFLVMTGRVNTTDPMALNGGDVQGRFDRLLYKLHKFSRDEIRYRLRHYFKFLFVRDPLERLLSAYKNKLFSKRAIRDYFHTIVAYRIAKRYRKVPISEIDPTYPNASFVEFVQYVSDLNPKKMNLHWQPYYTLCNPCLVDFDFVGKLENTDLDTQYIFKKAGIDKIMEPPPKYSHTKTNTYMQEEYSKLPPEVFQRLIAKYKADFVLFNYTIPEDGNSL